MGDYTLGDFRGGAGVSTGLSEGFGTPVFRGILSLEWVPQPPPLPATAVPPAEPVRLTEPVPHVDVPVVADRDHDGVLDADDACPDEPGKTDPDPKKNGCPKAFVRDGRIQILEQVRFATASAAITKGPDSESVLQAVADVLERHPEIARIRVEGHTDNRGNAAANKKLSAARAAAVVKWPAAHGVEASRLSSEGHGQEVPLADNATEEGRRQNRRVEFHIEGGRAVEAK
jgi:outer membrane protein OmpA-like peptidoglycan-associated protein